MAPTGEHSAAPAPDVTCMGPVEAGFLPSRETAPVDADRRLDLTLILAARAGEGGGALGLPLTCTPWA